MTWTASSDAAGYRIYYTSKSDSGSEEVGASGTNLILSGLKSGETYSISIVATSPDKPASSPITREVELSEYVCMCVVANDYNEMVCCPSLHCSACFRQVNYQNICYKKHSLHHLQLLPAQYLNWVSGQLETDWQGEKSSPQCKGRHKWPHHRRQLHYH